MIEIYVTTQFEALHRWADAPEEVDFLRHPHRHLFKVKAWAGVSHGDRDLEFFTLQREVEFYVRSVLERGDTGMSCEMMAQALLSALPGLCRVEVSEDGENGAVVSRTPAPALGGPSRHKPFMGVEAEGPRQGCKTLFFPGKTTAAEARAAAEYAGGNYAYYGAGDDRDLNEATLHYLIDKYGSMLTVEADESSARLLPLAYKRGALTVCLVPAPGTDYLKIIRPGAVHWVALDKEPIVHTTELSDPRFSQDRELRCKS